MSSQPPTPTPPGLFSAPKPERSFPVVAVAIAAVAVAVVAGVLIVNAMRHAGAPLPTTVQPVSAYADNLMVSNVEMSESTSISGGKVTYIDGHIVNKGDKTVTGVTVQVFFANDMELPPQIETVPLNLIRMREPYVDTEPVSAAPLAPNGEADFRLIFEDVPDNWNQQVPALHAIQVSTR